jgi:hypothetical protein
VQDYVLLIFHCGGHIFIGGELTNDEQRLPFWHCIIVLDRILSTARHLAINAGTVHPPAAPAIAPPPPAAQAAVTGPVAAEVPPEKRKIAHKALHAAIAPSTRKDRCDKIDIELLNNWWIDNTRPDTFGVAKEYTNAKGEKVFRLPHTQYEASATMYLQFLGSAEYLQWQMEHIDRKGQPRTIGYTKFLEGRCKCISKSKQCDCSNELYVGMLMLLDAMGEYRAMYDNEIRSCLCGAHTAAYSSYWELHKSLDHFLQHMLPCGKTEVPQFTVPVVGAANHPQYPQHGLQPQQQDGAHLPGHVYLFDRACAHGTCGRCGVGERLQHCCDVELSDVLTVTAKIFIDVPRTTATSSSSASAPGEEENEADEDEEGAASSAPSKSKAVKKSKPPRAKTQRELTERLLTLREFTELFRATAKRFLVHHWSARWDLCHRRAYLAKQRPHTLTVSTDYAAVYNCSPKYKLTSAQDAHVLQAVSCLISCCSAVLADVHVFAVATGVHCVV